jgi:anti-sigma regulatory factor (Ser/Thr protein kinase)
MRWWLRAFLGQSRGLTPEEIDDLILVACEAASNAVEHPQRSNEPYFEVCTQIDGRAVTIVIRDHGHWRQPPSPEVSGRGFQLMRALADTTVVTDTHGTTVTIRHDPEGALGSGRRGHELTDTDAPG